MISKSSRIAFILIVLGFFLKLVFLRYINPIDRMVFSDMANYIFLADQIIYDTWKETHFFQPIGFPLLIVWLKKNIFNWTRTLEWIHLIASVLTLWFVWLSTRKSFGERIGLISLGIAVFHLPWFVFTGVVLAEALFIFLMSLLALISVHLVQGPSPIKGALWGIVFFSAFILKGTHVFLAPLFLLGLFALYKTKSLVPVIIMSSIIGLGLVGHGLYTNQKIQKFQMSASAGGLNFVEGKCPIKNNRDSQGNSWLSPLYAQLGLRQQKQWDRPFTDSGYYMKEGMKCIAQNPSVLVQSLEGIPFLFVGNLLWPANITLIKNQFRLYDLFYGCFCIIGLVLFLRFLKQEDNKEELFLIWCLPILSLFLCVYIFKSEIRFRVPFDVWIIPVAVKGWSQMMRAKLT